ncbi:MAG TPA: gluconokinase [Pyrinomonadaceae bacterium]|nr:gluconokinase [Pyrinomonadaceae bacterium]
MSFILAIDVGTSSVRAALYDHAGNPIPHAFAKHERMLTVTDDGGAEIDADEALRQIVAAVDDVLKKASKIKGEITHVASSSFWHSLVGVDVKAKPTTKVLGWADTRSREQVAVLRRRFNEGEVHNRTGARFHSSFWPAKLLWLKKTDPKAFGRTVKWLSLSDYVALSLSGEPVTSISMASATGMFDIRRCRWDAPLSNYVGVKLANLPGIAEDRVSFSVNAAFAKRWPRLKDARWLPAIGDGAANNIGAGCVSRNKAALMVGTSGAMRVAYKGEPPSTIPEGLWCYRIDRERVIMGGALSDGGGLYQWLKDNLQLFADDNRTENEIAKRAPAAHGLTFLPFLAGERSTGYHENASGAIIGLTSSTDTIDIVQAALESVAYRFGEIFDQLNSVVKVRDVIASGGALRQSPVWTQMIADVLARDLTLPDTHEASSRGAVLLLLETIDKIKTIERIPTPEGRLFRTAKKRHTVYKHARREHEKFYQKTIKI